jgi:putative endonuclease
MAWVYILKCVDNTYYTGSTKNLERRIEEHQKGIGANYTQKRLPVTLIYFEEYKWIDDAFRREKQIQNWSRKKKEALINGRGKSSLKKATRESNNKSKKREKV